MQKIRNIAIIAHVDHGKTTLVDKMLILTGQFKDHEKPGALIMDSYELEKERGITILSKNASVIYKGVKINIIDTPGHADFGGEVERVLNMADGVLLLVDAFEGTMPQTRFVLQKAINLGLKPIVVINKVDKANCHPENVQEQIFDLMYSLGATEDQLNFPTLFGSSKEGWMSDDWKVATDNIDPLLDAIIKHIPAPVYNPGTLQLLITALNYSSYVGRIAIGRVHRGEVKLNTNVSLVKRDATVVRSKIKELFVFEGLKRKNVEVVQSGEICGIVGIEGFDIGDTVTDFENPEQLDPIAIDEPTMSMLFTINDSPFYGMEGKYVTSRHIKDRLTKELEKNLAMRLEQAGTADKFIVSGRGVLHLSVLIETMRREGYELQVGQPKVLFKDIAGIKSEPIEEMTVDVLDEFSGKVIDLVTSRKGELLNMENRGERTHLDFKIPSRGIIGLRTKMLTSTNGEAVISHRFIDYEPYRGEIDKRQTGALISMDDGIAFAYSIDKLQDRGRFFIAPTQKVYRGQVIGESTKSGDIVVNVCKPKKLTNIRASGSDDKIRLIPPIVFSLEEALEYIQEDEYVEITPKTIRLRKIILDETERKRNSKKDM
jgi:GTP-binding protein